MLKSKLGIKNSNKEKSSNSLNSVNSKDSIHSSKNSIKKLLNGKASSHSILNNIKPIKPKGSLYDLANIDKNEDQIKNEEDMDNTTLTSSPQTLDTSSRDKLSKTTDTQDLNTLNDTPTSPISPSWNTSVPSNTTPGKDSTSANTTFDSVNTIYHPSNINGSKTKSKSPLLTHLNTANLKVKSSGLTSPKGKPSSPYLSPTIRSPLETFARFKSSKSTDNVNAVSPTIGNSGNFLSVPNLNHLSSKGSSSSLHTSLSSNSIPNSESSTSLNKSSISKKLSKKEKKEANGTVKEGNNKKMEGKKPGSLFSSIGKYLKNKATKDKDKEAKKSKEKLEEVMNESNMNANANASPNVNADVTPVLNAPGEEEIVEIGSREVPSYGIEEEELGPGIPKNKDKFKNLTKLGGGISIITDDVGNKQKTSTEVDTLLTPTPKDYIQKSPAGLEEGYLHDKVGALECTPKIKNQSLKPDSQAKKTTNRLSASMQSMTLVDNSNKSEPSYLSSESSSKAMEDTLNITSSSPHSSSLTGSLKEGQCLSSEIVDQTEPLDSTDPLETSEALETLESNTTKNEDTSFSDNEDTIIKKSSVASTSNHRLSTRDINFCNELRLAGDIESHRNSLNMESTITNKKVQPFTPLSTEDKPSSKEGQDHDQVVSKDEKSNQVSPNEDSDRQYLSITSSPLPNSFITVRPDTESDNQMHDLTSNSSTANKNKLFKHSSYEVPPENVFSFEDTSMIDSSSLTDFEHNVLACSPQLSIASPYSHTNFSYSSASKSPTQDKKFNIFVPKAPSAIGLVTTPSNSTQNTQLNGASSSNHPISSSLDAIPMAGMDEPEERRCPHCHCILPVDVTLNNISLRHFDPISMDSLSMEEDQYSINSTSHFSSITKLTGSPKQSPKSTSADRVEPIHPKVTNSHHFGQYLGSGGPGSIASLTSSVSSQSIHSSYTYSTVTTTSEEDCSCYCHDVRYHHPNLPVYHTKHNTSHSQDPMNSKASVSGVSFSSLHSRYSNFSAFTAESLNKIYDKRSYCSSNSAFSLTNSLLFGGKSHSTGTKNKNSIRRKDFSKSTREIGRGATCVVKLVHKINDPTMLFALKEYKLTKVKQDIDERTFLKHLRNEYQIGSLLHHPNVIETFAFLMTKTHNHKRRKYFVVLEYCEGGDLFNTIQEGKLGRQEINCNFRQLMDGVNYLHSLGVAHCDIKPENILIKNVSQLKIIDFGTSEIFRYPYNPDVIKKSKGVKGSKPYIAPEQFQKAEYDPRASDIWSCAIVYIASLFDELPWRVATLEDFDFLRWKKERKNDLIRHIPDGPRQLITQMLNPDPDKRITMEQIYENEWFSSIKTCISGEVQCHDKKHRHIQPHDS